MVVSFGLGFAFQGLLRLFFFHVFSVLFGNVATKCAEPTTFTKETKIHGVVAFRELGLHAHHCGLRGGANFVWAAWFMEKLADSLAQHARLRNMWYISILEQSSVY